MRNEEDLDAGASRSGHDRAEVFEKADVFGNRLDHRPELAAIREEIVVGVYQ
jgi:hypothetical protein